MMSTKKSKKYSYIRPNDQEKALVVKSKYPKWLKTVRNFFTNTILLAVVPLILIYLAELISREDFGKTFIYMYTNGGIVLLNMILIYFMYFLLQTITNKTPLSVTITSIIYLLIPIISKLKYDIRGEVLLSNDLNLASNASEIIGFVSISPLLSKIFAFTGLILIALVLILIWINHKSKRINNLIPMLMFTLCVFMIFVSPLSTASIKKFGIDSELRYSVNVIADKYGSVMGFYSNHLMNQIQVPEEYSKEKVFEILDNVSKETKKNIPSSGDVKNPNIIMIMSESFFDPTKIPNVSYSKDPIPYIREYIKEYTSGTFVSSTFAGGTANIEFEAFTGESVQFVPYGSTPYTDFGENIKSIDTLPKILKSNGYNTVALHTYDGAFYNRNQVYPNFGFDKFIDMFSMDKVGYYGKYVSDNTLVDNIIEQLEANNASGDAPAFIWALSMQNHAPYSKSNFDEDAIKIDVSGDMLTDVGKDKLTGYVNGVYATDRTMKTLLDYLDSSDIPTVVLFFGDHLPGIYETYYDTKMIETKDTSLWTADEMLKMHSGNFFIYNNYDESKNKNHNETIGAALLGNYLLNYANIEKPIYFKFLDTLNYRATRDRLFVDDNCKISISIPEKNAQKVSEHKMLQYDMLYGEKYLLEWSKLHLTI